MKRPMWVIGGFFALTMWAAFFLSGGAALRLSVLLVPVALAVYFLPGKRRPALAAAMLSAALALGVYSLYCARSVAPFEAARGRRVVVEGFITQADRYTRSTRYRLRASFPESGLPDAELILWTFGEAEYVAGEVIRCEAELSAMPQSSVRYYRSVGVSAAASAVGPVEKLQDPGVFRFDRFVFAARERLQSNLRDKLPGDTAELIALMVLRLGDSVDKPVARQMQRTGISHLLAVSGLHLSILTGILLQMLEIARSSRRAGAAVTILAVFAFVLLTGCSASVVRAGVMLVLTLLGRLLNRRADSLNSLGLALLLMTALFPHWTLGASLWLSAAATLGLLALGGPLYERLVARIPTAGPVARSLLSSACLSAGAYLFTLPVLTVTTGWVPLLSPLVNVLISPFVPGALFGGLVCAVLPGNWLLVRPFALLTRFCIRAILAVSGLFAGIPGVYFTLSEGYHLIWLACVLVLGILTLVFRGNPLVIRCAALLCVLSLSVGSLSLRAVSRGVVELVSLTDCDTTLLLRDGEAVLLGTPTRQDIDRLISYLDYRDISHIAAVLAFDCGEQIDSGLLRLAETYAVDCVIGPDDDYILSELADALPQVTVFSGGYADISLLGGVQARAAQGAQVINLQIGAQAVLKSTESCAIVKEYGGETLRIYNSGAMLLPHGAPAQYLPLGGYLFGETRVLLRV